MPSTSQCRQPAVIDFPPPQFDAAFVDRKMRAHRDWREQRTAELVADAVTEVAGAIGFVQQLRTSQIEAPIPRLLHTENPDPALAVDAHQFIRVELLDHTEVCEAEGCESETRIAVSSESDPSGSPYCQAHVHVLFADWMVGA